jgi:putative endonuclease
MADWWRCLPWCSDPRARWGRRAERAALRHLRRRGLRLVTRNYRARGGEIDLIMHDGAILVFVEVRLRSNDRFGDGAASVGLAKQRRLIRAARQFIAARASPQTHCRFDVVSVRKPHYRLHLQWIRNAFTA